MPSISFCCNCITSNPPPWSDLARTCFASFPESILYCGHCRAQHRFELRPRDAPIPVRVHALERHPTRTVLRRGLDVHGCGKEFRIVDAPRPPGPKETDDLPTRALSRENELCTISSRFFNDVFDFTAELQAPSVLRFIIQDVGREVLR